MDKFKIKEIIESSLKGLIANVDGSEGKYTATIIYERITICSSLNVLAIPFIIALFLLPFL